MTFYKKIISMNMVLLRLYPLLAASIEILPTNHTRTHEENTTLVSTYGARTN